MNRATRSITFVILLFATFLLTACEVTLVDNTSTLEANKVIVQRFYEEIWNNRDLAVVDEIIAEDFIDRFSGQNGREAFKGTVQFFHNAYPDLKATYTDVVAEGDVVAVYVTFTGTYQGGMAEVFGIPDSAIGTETVLNGVDYARIEDGVMVEGWGAHEELGRFLQLGFELVPPSGE